jgi:hypothetical protein
VDVDDPPALRAIPEEGRPWDSPSEERLYLLLQDIEAGAGDFLIVERATDPRGETYAQVLRTDDSSYVVEHREGDAENHYSTVVPDMRAAWEMLTGWAFQRPGWDEEASWSRVDYDPPPDTGAGLAPPAPTPGPDPRWPQKADFPATGKIEGQARYGRGLVRSFRYRNSEGAGQRSAEPINAKSRPTSGYSTDPDSRPSTATHPQGRPQA